MNRQNINRMCWIVPVALSVVAFGLVIFAVSTGHEERADEGILTHLFWLSVLLEGPFILGFLATADWRRARRVALPLIFQAGARALAFGSVAWFRL